MKTRIALLVAVAALGLMPAHASGGTQTRSCPLPGVGGDPDRVSLSGPIAGPINGKVAYAVKVDESPGEDSHAVAGVFVATSSNGGGTMVAEAAGLAPAVGTLTLDAGHAYSVQWIATFDFGIHPCASAQPGQSPFQVSA